MSGLGNEMRPDPSIDKVANLLRRYASTYGAPNPICEDPTRPFREVAEYVAEAWRAKLDSREECAYAGSIFLHSILNLTGRRFAEDVTEANELYTSGLRAANYLWRVLDDNSRNLKPSELSRMFPRFVLSDIYDFLEKKLKEDVKGVKV